MHFNDSEQIKNLIDPIGRDPPDIEKCQESHQK